MAHAVGNIGEAQQPVPAQENRTLCGKAQKIFASIVVAAHPATIGLSIRRVSVFFKDELFSLVERVKISIGFSYWRKSSGEKKYFCEGGGQYGMERVHFPKFLYRLPSDWLIFFNFEVLAGSNAMECREKLEKIWKTTKVPNYNGPTFIVNDRGTRAIFPHGNSNIHGLLANFLAPEECTRRFYFQD